jgi:muramoyltetrapeptide carboxypeptidase
MGNIKIEPGDLVRIVAPAGQGAAVNLPKIKTYVESLGLVAAIRDDIYDPEDPFYSNSDDIRAQDLIDALTDDNCKVIWCIRGGSGCIRLIKYLEANLPPPETPPTPKIVIGFSDITVIHLYLQHKYNWATIHGPMLEAISNGFFDPDGESVKSLTDLLFNVTTTICEPMLTRIDSRGGALSISTEVVGGNLTLVETSIGTLWEINGRGKIIFLEDVGEAAYSIERSFDHMKQAGVFDGAAAIVLGDFTDPDSQTLINYVFQRFADDEMISCPVLKLAGIGHGATNYPLPLNTLAYIEGQDAVYTLCIRNLP